MQITCAQLKVDIISFSKTKHCSVFTSLLVLSAHNPRSFSSLHCGVSRAFVETCKYSSCLHCTPKNPMVMSVFLPSVSAASTGTQNMINVAHVCKTGIPPAPSALSELWGWNVWRVSKAAGAELEKPWGFGIRKAPYGPGFHFGSLLHIEI